MKRIHSLEAARNFIKQGKLIAYPTEAVYGLGCDPFNEKAVRRLLTLKNRSIEKGFILLIAHWEQLFSLIAPIQDELLIPIKASWPGPVTWIFPKSQKIPPWLCGNWNSIAIRMSAHPIAHQLALENPLISTSANLSGYEAARSIEEVIRQFPSGIDGLVTGPLGGAKQPSAIFDVLSGQQLR